MALVTGGDAAEAGVLQLRGALTSIVYVPPAILAAWIGPESAPWTVLLWNALLAAALCAVLIPRIADLVTPGPSAWRIWASALAGGVVLSGFSRFPLLDVWALAFALTGLYLLAVGKRWWVAAMAGVLLVVATNVRPAYLAPVLIAAVVLLIARPRYVPWAVPGAIVGIVPQIVFNMMAFGQVSLVPIQTPYLMNVQATFATFASRYDTVLEPDRYPSQFYCDPGFAAVQLDDTVPTSAPGVLLSGLSHLPDSLAFWTGKAAASLHWTFGTPYEYSPGTGTSLMTPFILALAAGLVMLIWASIVVWKERMPRMVSLALIGFWIGATGTLVLSTPETRFAMPLVFVGLIGWLTVLSAPLRMPERKWMAVVALAVTVMLAIFLFVVGNGALTHPMPPGNVPTLDSCADWMPLPTGG